ncbi:MAG: DUF899 family protein [Myxococcota bacterium]|nr:DUF899 family protein [Myxococcota bacterium]
MTTTVGRLAGESPEYAKVRDEIQEAEIALRDQRERVAELRRGLPHDQVVADETFQEIRDGQLAPVKLSELFDESDKPVVLMHFMYGGSMSSPCPMCTCWADGYDGVLPHLEQKVHFAVFIAGDPGLFGAYARARGWKNLRVVAAGESDLKRRLGFENEEGGQQPGVSVFTRNEAGEIVHFYSQSAFYGEPGFRGMDLLNPLWHFLDVTPEGRGDFFPAKQY